MRTITKIASVTPIKMQTSSVNVSRVIGSVDIDGQGTNHSLVDVDPFIFLDDSIIEGEISSAFKKHPHKGLIAVTYLLEGVVHAWDNIHGATPTLNHAGGVYWINTGRGVVHGEAPIKGVKKIRLLQLWYQPELNNDILPKARYQLFQPNDLPVFNDDDCSVKVIIGEGFNLFSPVDTPWPIQYLHIKLKGNKIKDFIIHDKRWAGFIYIIEGRGKFGANALSAGPQSCLVLGSEDSNIITIQNEDTDSLEFILALGQPHNKPFVKLLGYGGAIIADSDTNARKSMQIYEAAPEHFGTH